MVPSGSAEVSALPSRPNCLSSSSSVFSNVDREPPFSRVRLPFSFLSPPSPPLSPLQSAFIYRGRESFAVQMDPLRYYVADFNKENQFWLCLQNQPHTSINRGNISSAEISSCCLFAWERKKNTKARNES